MVKKEKQNTGLKQKADLKQETGLKQKIVVILGPTASGKTTLGVKLAARLKGEIISADSRQVYRGMDIGTGKDLGEYKVGRKKIPYHLIDIIKPNTKFSLARYQKLAAKAVLDISARGNLPLVVGGTGLYLQALVENFKLPIGKSDNKQREEWEKLGAEKLFTALSQEKPEFAQRINYSDQRNARRLARYLEIVRSGGDIFRAGQESLFDALVIGIDIDDNLMREKIVTRLKKRLDDEDLIGEVQRLKAAGVSYRRLISFGLEYKFVANFLQGKLTREEMEEKLATAIYRFAKRQKTWFKRWEKQGRKIHWIKSLAEGERMINKFIKKRPH